MTLDRWNERYSNDEFAYGTEPNNYLKRLLQKLEIGSILFPAEGEGRDAVLAVNFGGMFLHLTLVQKEKTKPNCLQKAIL